MGCFSSLQILPYNNFTLTGRRVKESFHLKSRQQLNKANEKNVTNIISDSLLANALSKEITFRLKENIPKNAENEFIDLRCSSDY